MVTHATASQYHVTTDPAILYFGTPVVLLSTCNPDGSTNLAPISAVFWLGHGAVIGVAPHSQSGRNLARTGEVVLALPSAGLVDAVNRLALTTGLESVPPDRYALGYRHVHDKYEHAGLTPVGSEKIAPPRPAECPVAMECVVKPGQSGSNSWTVELDVIRVHAHPAILVPGRPNRIDPDRWRPLIMSFQKFYGLSDQVSLSRLASIDEDRYR